MVAKPSRAPRTSPAITQPRCLSLGKATIGGGETVSVQAFNGTTWDTLATLAVIRPTTSPWR